MKLSRISKNVGVEVSGINLSNDMSKGDLFNLQNGLQNSGLLVIRDQDVSPERLLSFSKYFGEIAAYTRSKFSLEGYPDILVLSNVMKDGKMKGSPVSGRVWHIDGHYLDNIPSVTILSMKTLQRQGGNTYFANMQRAWELLPGSIAPRVFGLEMVVSRTKSREYNYPERGPATPEEAKEWKDVIHPMLLMHPRTGRNGLGVGGNVPWEVSGLDAAASIPLITFLQEWVAQPDFTYEHVWREGDVIIWDNLVVMHKASPYEGDRLLHRTTVYRDGEGPSP